LVGCVAQQRERFKAELARLQAFECKAVVIEANVEDVAVAVLPEGSRVEVSGKVMSQE